MRVAISSSRLAAFDPQLPQLQGAVLVDLLLRAHPLIDAAPHGVVGVAGLIGRLLLLDLQLILGRMYKSSADGRYPSLRRTYHFLHSLVFDFYVYLL